MMQRGLTRTAIAAFGVAVVLGPLYTAPGYSPLRHVISELAAQNTPHRGLMVAAFVGMGVALVADGLRSFRPALLPFMVFGLCFGAAGLFGHKPITPGVPYVEWVDALHSGLATAAGLALTLGFVGQALRAPSPAARGVAALLAAACVLLPLCMLWQPAVQGLVQRAMYAVVFAWLWACYPRRAAA